MSAQISLVPSGITAAGTGRALAASTEGARFRGTFGGWSGQAMPVTTAAAKTSASVTAKRTADTGYHNPIGDGIRPPRGTG